MQDKNGIIIIGCKGRLNIALVALLVDTLLGQGAEVSYAGLRCGSETEMAIGPAESLAGTDMSVMAGKAGPVTLEELRDLILGVPVAIETHFEEARANHPSNLAQKAKAAVEGAKRSHKKREGGAELGKPADGQTNLVPPGPPAGGPGSDPDHDKEKEQTSMEGNEAQTGGNAADETSTGGATEATETAASETATEGGTSEQTGETQAAE